MFCTNCGKPLEEGARFCSNCGAPVEAVPVAETPATAIPVVAVSAPETPVVEPPVEEVPTLEIPTEEVIEPVEATLENAVPQQKAISYQQPVDAAPVTPAAPAKSKKKKVWIIVGIAIAVFILIVVGVAIGLKSFFNKVKEQYNIETQSDEEYIDVVREGYMFEYGYQTVGEAFEAFFSDPEWKYFQASDGDHMVQFEGGCLYDGEETEFLAQFIVDNYDFELYAIELDGVVQDSELYDGYLSVIFEDESQNGMEEDPTKGSSSNSGSSTTSQKNALESAQSYISSLAFSYTGLIEQLEWEGYSEEDAIYAADNCGADWYKEAEESVDSYLSFMGFSYTGLIDQLEYEGFTTDQATKAVDACGADWNEQAAKCAQSYMDSLSFSRDELIDQLEFDGFTYDQAVYGAAAVGY
ncbi:MAG: Ltp family lipoprotein [Lachnospiraceae bacterium]|nr:Ltp family lipoprotein [Lachnospiraceae bacterium]